MAGVKQYRAAVRRYLAEGYGATNFVLESGGAHFKLLYTLPDRGRHSLLLNDRNGAGGSNALNIKFQDIRRKHGAPSYPGHRPTGNRRLDTMTAELQAKSPELVADWKEKIPHLQGRMSWNAKLRRVVVVIDDAAYNTFRCVSSIKLIKRSASQFEIVPSADPKTPKFRREKNGRNWVVELTAKAEMFSDHPDSFGRSPVNLFVSEKSITFTVDWGSVNPVSPSRWTSKQPSLPHHVADKLPSTEASPGLPTRALVGLPSTAEERMREVLRTILDVEATTHYRLKKVKTEHGEEWRFRAPDITPY